MSKLIRRKKEIGAALAVALQLTTLGLIGLIAQFTAGPQQPAKASADTQVSAPAQQGAPALQQTTQTDQAPTVQPLTAADKASLRSSAHFAKKLYEPLASQVFDLATARAESAQQQAQQAHQAQQAQQSESPNGPTLTTDREDYPPYSYVYFTGTGFQPGETVDMLVVETDPVQQSFDPWTVVADENGNFQTSWYVYSGDFNGATFLATATGESSQLTASATFTDAFGDGTMDVSPGSALTSSTGNSFTFSFRNVAQTFSGGGAHADVVVPAGWTAPQSTTPGNPGYVSATGVGGGTILGALTVSAGPPWTITIPFNTAGPSGQGFDLTYAGGGTKVTAPSTTGVSPFTTGSNNGGGAAPAIFSSPSIVVSPTILQRGTATIGSVSNGTLLTINKPTGVVQGDLMIANFALNNTNSGAPSLLGWTSIVTQNTGIRAALLYKVAGGSEPTSYTFTWTTAAKAEGAIVAFSGVDTVSGPFDVTPGTYTIGNGGGGAKDPAAVTVITNATANAAIVMFASSPGGIVTGQFQTSTSPPSPPGLGELYGDIVDSNGNVGAGWGIKTTGGSTTGAGSAARSPSGNNNAWAAILLALKPITCTAPSVTTNPSSQTVTYGAASVSFTATASGSPAPTVQWQSSTNGGGTWNDLAGQTNTTLTISNPAVASPAVQYRAVFTNTCNGTQTATTTAATLTVNKANATVVVTPYSVTYDNNPHTATVTSITGVNGETGATVGTVNVTNTTHTNAGTYSSDTWTFTGTANYNNIAATTITDTINKATPTATLSVTNSPQIYSGSGQSALVSATSSVPGAVANILTGGAATKTNAGTYAVTADFVPTDTANYNSLIGLSAGNFVINKATPTATLSVTNSPQTYNGSGQSALVSATSSVPGAVANILTGGAATKTNAGTYAVTADFVPTDTANYNTLTGLSAGNFIINKANATFTVTPYTCPTTTYTGLTHTATVSTITGVNGETGATVGTVDVTDTIHTAAGIYPGDQWTFTGGANYNNTSGTVDDCIAKANATVVVTPYTCPTTTYTGLPHTASYTLNGVNGETGATVGTVNVSNTTHTNAGTYAVDYWFFTGAANYNDIGNTTITDCIAKATATVVVTSYTCPSTTYTGLPHTATYTLTGVNGEAGATVGMVDVSNTTHTDAGTYAADYWFFTGAANYNNIGNTTITDCIAKATAVVVVDPYTCPTTTYTGLSHTATVVSITGVNGETGATVGAVDVSNTTHTDAGTYAADYWFFTGTGNYNNIGNTTITDCIAKATATVVVTPYTCPSTTYTGLSHTATVTSITGVNGETGVTVGAVDVSNTTHADAGTYAADYWFFTGTANYNNIGNTTITDCIAKATATVVVTSYTCPSTAYTGLSHTATVTSITGVNGETGATVGAADVSNTTHTDAGTYAADYWFFTGTANYNNIGNTTITDCIAKATPTVVVTGYSVTYDGQPHTATVTSITGVNGETGATVGSVDVSGTTHTNAGSYDDHWTFTATANYNNIGPTLVLDTIDPKAASVTPDAATKVYGSVDPAFTGTLTGFLAADGVTATYSRTAGETVLGSPYAISATLSPAAVLSNYSITYNTASFTIDAKAASATPAAASKIYGAADPAFTGMLTGFLAADGVTATYSRTTGETVLGSPYTISATLSPAAVLSNYSITYNTASFTIDAKAASVTPNAASKIYGAADPAFSGTLTGFLAADGVTATYSRTAGETVLGSPYTISATLIPAGVLSNYSITYNTANFTINPATLSIAADHKTKTYGAVDPALTYVASGFQFGDTAATVLTGALTRAAGENVGSYAISQGTLAANANYTISFTGHDLVIDPATLSIAADHKTKTYGAADPALTYVASGFQFGDTAATVLTGALARATGENVGSYAISQGTLAANANYTISFTGHDLVIDPATLSIAADHKTKTYGAVDPALTYVASGFQFGDTAATVLTGALTRAAGENVGSYAISQGTLVANANYTISFTGHDLVIDPATLAIAADHKTKTYGAADPALTYVATGFQFGDTAATVLTGALTRAAGENVGSYAISQGTLVANANYTISFTGHDLVIDPATLAIAADHKTKTYGAADPALTYVASGFQFGDTAATVLTGALTRAAGENVGSYAISQGTLVANANYTISFTGHDLVIDPATLGITANNQSKTYGNTFAFTGSEFTISSGTLYFSDTVTSVTLSSAGAAATATVAGSPYTITPSAAVGSGLGNYIISYHDASIGLTVDAITLDITANNQSKNYGATFSFTGTEFSTGAGQLKNSDTVTTVSLTSTGAPGTSIVGGYPIVPSAAFGSGLGNYNIVYHDGTLTVDAIALDITANNQSKNYGATFTFTGSEFAVGPGQLKNSDSVTSVTLSSAGAAATATVAGSPYTITPSAAVGSGLGNYIISYHDASIGLTVNAIVLDITANNQSKTYGVTFTFTGTEFTAGAGQLVNGDSVTSITLTSTGAPATATVSGSPYGIGASNATGTGLGNYIISYHDGSLTVTKAHLTVTAQDKSRTYGAANPTFTAAITGFVNGETIAVVSGSPAFSGTGPSSTATTAVGDYVITPAVGTLSATNYDFTPFVNGTLHITKAHLTVTADDKSRTYGAANPTFTAAITGFVNGETIAVVSGSPAFSGTGPSSTATTAVGDYVITPAVGTLSATNYDFTPFVNGTLHITKAHLTVTAQDKSRTYGAANPTFTAAITGFVNGETIAVVSGSPTFSGTGPSSTATTAVGDYVITPTVGTLSATNYDFTPFVNGTLHITQATLTITATARTKVFGATYTPDTTPPSVDFNVTGLVNSDSVTSITLTCAGYAAAALPTPTPYPVVPSAAVGTGLGNYSIGYVNGQLTIGYGTCTGGTPGHVILPPINSDGSSVWKVGSTVPVKFTVCDANGNPISDPTAVFATGYGGITLINTVRGTVNNINETTYTDIPDSAFRWSGGQWIFNMATSNLQKNTTYTFRINLKDGSYIEFTAGTK